MNLKHDNEVIQNDQIIDDETFSFGIIPIIKVAYISLFLLLLNSKIDKLLSKLINSPVN